MSDSRISGLYRLGIAERIDELHRLGWLSDADAELLRQGRQTLLRGNADKMIENVVGVFGLPFAIAPNFLVNGRDYMVPMVVEEASIVAATSSAARLARAGGGFAAQCAEMMLVGQIHLYDVPDVNDAIERLDARTEDLLAHANSVHPRLIERGGGATGIELRSIDLGDGQRIVAVHLLIDTCDAMGANVVNTICEAVAPQIVEVCGGKVALRILSNLADRALVRANVRYRLEDLAVADIDAATVRDQIVLASDIACADPYRATTHNKGIMNGIDALVIATGNDWRAVEAGAHAYAAVGGAYQPLATWSVGAGGDLAGEITIPLKLGIVGGNLDANAGAAFGLRITGVRSARELAELTAAVGLAQNFAALRALATKGIQQGHMKLHARSVAASADVPDELFDEVVDELVADGEIKVWKAAEILQQKRSRSASESAAGTAAGKVILLGEHAVVYGKHAVALPIADAVTADVKMSKQASTVSVPAWNVRDQVVSDDTSGIGAAVALVQRELGIADSRFAICLHSILPRAMGLGSSAAFAVAIVRAFDSELGLGLDDAKISAIAFACEELAHGTPSGIDNTVATYGEAVLFRRAESLELEELNLVEPVPLVIACSSRPGLTMEQVAGVRRRREQGRAHYDAVFEQMDALSLTGAAALARADYVELGMLMNVCHGLLNAIEVSTPELESMVSIARAAGAVGAKVTGGGGGGSIVALCPGAVENVRKALHEAGFRTLDFT